MKISFSIKFLTLVLLTALPAFINYLSAQNNQITLNKELKKLQKSSNLPGFAIAFIKKDSLLFSNGYGYADIKKKIPYTVETIQPVGSISKTFIGLAIMKAVEQGYFTLETPINNILPFKVANPFFPDSSITIRHLVTHTSGLVDNDTTYILAYNEGKKPAMSLKDFLIAYYTPAGKYYSTANFNNTLPGKAYSYTNIGSALAAFLIEVKTGITFADYTATYIFEPLQMKNSHWFYDDTKSKAYATLYEVNKQDLPIYNTILNKDGSLKIYSCATYPDGSLKTSVADLSRYLIAMMKGYTGQPGILTTPSFTTLFTKQFTDTNMPANMDVKEPNRGIFWAYNRRGKIIHTGGDPGISAFISFDPVTTIGRIIILNTQLDGEDNIKTVEYFKKIISVLDTYEGNIK